MSHRSALFAAIRDATASLEALAADDAAIAAIGRFADATREALGRGGRVFACGNGGSMAAAMHFAEEWTGRFRKDRAALPALAFADPAQLTCIANDFGYEQVFARMLEAYAKPGDALVALSTSGKSPNVLAACRVAKKKGVAVVGLLGRGGGPMKDLCDVAVVVPVATTSDRIQEIHIKVIHAVIEAVERRMFPTNY
jgi:D-sedoheptulose 7-phosphate isomerase